ncbi:MAG TPA: cytochrome P460 family protein [Acidobacteriota bacterium]|nr:cytochrome P460 family protein [Acidobacteriota bacterium]
MKLYSKYRNQTLLLFVLILGFSVAGLLTAAAGPAFQEKLVFNGDNELQRPDFSFRNWRYIGTPVTPNDLNSGKAPFPEFHNVYIHPDDYDYYARTGKFRDGTALIKELVSVSSKQAPSGNGYFMGDFIGLEVAVKDSRRFPDEPGYWAYFSYGHSYPLKEKAAAQPTDTCNACHQANAADDWVFSQYYPVLRAAKTVPMGGGSQ